MAKIKQNINLFKITVSILYDPGKCYCSVFESYHISEMLARTLNLFRVQVASASLPSAEASEAITTSEMARTLVRGHQTLQSLFAVRSLKFKSPCSPLREIV